MNRTLLLFAAALLASPGFGQDVSKDSDGKADARPLSPLRKLMDESLAWNELFPNERSATPMTARVVLRWTNNARGSADGMTVLYLADGRPAAVCCIYPWEQALHHEFDSLSRGTLIAKRDGVVVWNPEKSGVQFQSVPAADAPADTPAARLRQMKTLAGEFSSTMLGWKADSSDREPLRLLPQPLYRYETQAGNVLDGAVFAFVQGTDPESLLLLEAVKVGDRFEWQFAFARRTAGELEGRYKDAVVWHAARFPASTDPRSVHRTLRRPMEPTVSGDLPQKGDRS